MKYELCKEQIEALYDFAEMFNTEDVRKMVDDRLTSKQLHDFDKVLNTIYKTYQGKL